ncbi:Sat8 [Stachybotrys chartarum IBT 40293]|nr:Sat8 [Stachybotrys chartarum IBT 40293]
MATTLLLFGPQAASMSKQSITQLQVALRDQEWAFDALSNVQPIIQRASTSISGLDQISLDERLADLTRWLKHGPKDQEELAEIPNIMLAPLTTLSHLVQYRRYIERHYPNESDAHAALLQQKPVATLGFCNGLLAAFATTSSATLNDWERYAAVATRLALLVGAVIDAADELQPHGPAASYGVSWRDIDGARQLEQILSPFPGDAYVSVWYDRSRATVTVSKHLVRTVLHLVEAAGMAVVPVRLRGRYHSRQHAEVAEALIRLCDAEPDLLALPDARNLCLPTYSNVGHGEVVREGRLHEIALQAMLVQQCDWYSTLSGITDESQVQVVCLSEVSTLPPSLTFKLKPQMEYFAPLEEKTAPKDNFSGRADGGSQFSFSMLENSTSPPSPAATSSNSHCEYSVDPRDIAIVGMSVKVAGADDVVEYESILRGGVSQHQQVRKNRVPFGYNSFRPEEPGHKWYGNFVRDVDAFDHKFFRKSSRESAAMDPQQRLVLQAAYQAVEQSGYYASGTEPDQHIGVYLGTCATDYEQNANCHAPGAFTVTGLLRGFIAGRISHFFGWTGPAMTYDTACSGSAVAIHSAVQALVSGECSAALAGGVNTIGNEVWFQNLAGAQFLSPTGQCKPFDDAADGYCRGEGIACVVLKPMAKAIADGNQIFGRIASSAVHQSVNCTPLFVPNVPSLSRLFGDVMRQARLEPHDISFVEAHGTGTPVGDPVEYESIRAILGGPLRDKPLSLGSAKGLVGHTESTSGVVSLVKVLLMMQSGFIPPQASYSKLSHRIAPSASAMIQVSTTLQPWTDSYKAALINNYGASGSNAAMVVTQGPAQTARSPRGEADGAHLPFWIPGFDSARIAAYCARLSAFIEANRSTIHLADIAYNISRQSNRTLSHALLFRCNSIDSLVGQLSSAAAPQTVQVKPSRPVILCFGGQMSTFVGLNREIYDSSPILRDHLSQCDAAIRALGFGSIFPSIFATIPIEDTVLLQTVLFSFQYACAKSWIDCGVRPTAVVGHSFGEITALCIAEVLSLDDTIKLVTRRAKVVRDSWGADRGVMMAVEGEVDQVERLLEEANKDLDTHSPASIACYNGLRNFTLAGSTLAMERVALALSSSAYASIRGKKLNVTNAFHSALVDPLLQELEQAGSDLTFNKARIKVERATKESTTGEPCAPKFVGEHMRNPVFFRQAAQRLARDNPSAVWIEAGSATKITAMARRSLDSNAESHFQGITVTGEDGLDKLTEATLSLWKQGLNVAFWAHHGPQATRDHQPLLLPPYQFEKSRHWLDVKAPPVMLADTAQGDNGPLFGLLTFVGFQDAEERRARFKINTESERYKSLVIPHIIARTAPICPATLEYSLAIQALLTLRDHKHFESRDMHPVIRDMRNDAPLCLNSDQSTWLDLEANKTSPRSLVWKVFTAPVSRQLDSHNDSDETLCAQGKLDLLSSSETTEFAQYEQLATYDACVSLLQDDDGDVSGLQGRSVYRSLADVVDYGVHYQKVRRVSGRNSESAGIVRGASGGNWLSDLPIIDSFSQVAGVWVNCLADRTPGSDDLFLATGCETIMTSPTFLHADRGGKSWHVWAKHHRESERSYRTDVLVFDATNGQLADVFLGIAYTRIPRHSMTRLLSKLSEPSALQAQAALPSSTGHEGLTAKTASSQRLGQDTLKQTVGQIIASLSGVEAAQITDESALADIGIDSLAGMELARDIESVLGCKLDLEELLFTHDTFGAFVRYISKVVNGEDDLGTPSHSDNDSHVTGTTATPNSSSASSDTHHGNSKLQIAVAQSSQADASSSSPLPPQHVISSFEQVKLSTDQRIREEKADNTDDIIVSRSNLLCVALVVEAFEQLGCPLRGVPAGEALKRIQHAPQHARLVDWLYRFLEDEARLINTEGTLILRTSNGAPNKTSQAIFQDLEHANDRWIESHRLANYAGKNLADVVSGKKEGIHVLFGSAEGRELVRGLYSGLPFNCLFYKQVRDTISLIVEKVKDDFQGPLRILEMGAGTGGTTQVLAPFLATLDIPVEYTMTDLSPYMVAQAQRSFGTKYPFMHFAVHDIEKPPAESLLGTQHIIVASNAVHATANLADSAANIRSTLRPDGILLLVEMTESLPFVDIVFGLLEGWWRFADGREHAIVPAEQWEARLRDAGYGHVDWTDGVFSENRLQKVILAMASELPDGLPVSSGVPEPVQPALEVTTTVAREANAEAYVTQYSADFTYDGESSGNIEAHEAQDSRIVVVTGATGSLGSHMVASFAESPSVTSVVCINRRNSGKATALERQQEAFTSRGITLSPDAFGKLRVFATDTAQPQLGLPLEEYEWLVTHATHIVHNAWPMSASRPIQAFQPQFKTMSRLLDLAAAIAQQSTSRCVVFQLISSIGVVGSAPMIDTRVPERRVPVSYTLPNGYCEAKWVCEQLLNETLHQYPERFRAMVVRPGQIAGSSVNGVWNPVEHFPALVRSSQALRAFPALGGTLQWIPVDVAAGTVADLALNQQAGEPVYHIDNPVGQSWSDMVPILADELNIPGERIIPLGEWVRKVKRSSLLETENPASRLPDFFEQHFERMSCGGLILDVALATKRSGTLAAQGAVSADTARKYIQTWKDMKFLDRY